MIQSPAITTIKDVFAKLFRFSRYNESIVAAASTQSSASVINPDLAKYRTPGIKYLTNTTGELKSKTGVEIFVGTVNRRNDAAIPNILKKCLFRFVFPIRYMPKPNNEIPTTKTPP
jgi:hypothetical protein